PLRVEVGGQTQARKQPGQELDQLAFEGGYGDGEAKQRARQRQGVGGPGVALDEARRDQAALRMSEEQDRPLGPGGRDVIEEHLEIFDVVVEGLDVAALAVAASVSSGVDPANPIPCV